LSFVQINCAALPETLLEAELFGYEKGAFTGARDQGKMGLFEMAQGGTLFLDELGELSQAVQAKLLKCLEDKEITHLGGLIPIKIDCTVIAATNVDLVDQVNHKNFRQDLFFRLNTFTLTLPPLHNAEVLLANTTKHCFIGPISGFLVKKLAEMAAAAVVGGVEELRQRPILSFNTCPVSPLKLVRDTCEIIMEGARHGLAVNVLSMAMAGGSSPVNLAGTMVTHNAEVLAGGAGDSRVEACLNPFKNTRT